MCNDKPGAAFWVITDGTDMVECVEWVQLGEGLVQLSDMCGVAPRCEEVLWVTMWEGWVMEGDILMPPPPCKLLQRGGLE